MTMRNNYSFRSIHFVSSLTYQTFERALFDYWRLKPFFTWGLCMVFLSFPSLAEDTTVNRMLASQCAQCHGPDGKAVAGMEKLTDESAKDLYEDLRDMRREDNPENIMDHQALGYTEDQIRRIADYIGSLSGKNEDRDDEDRDDEDRDDEDRDDEDRDDEDKDDEDRDDEDRKEKHKKRDLKKYKKHDH